MLQKLIPGAQLDVVSRQELEELLKQYQVRRDTRDRIRAPETVRLDATGTGQVDVFTVPIGFEVEVRRVFLDLSTADETTLTTGSINLNAAGVSVGYYRSDTRIEWGLPVSSLGGFRVPGIETWGKEQGPYLRNGETFRVRVLLGAAAANAMLTVTVEGIQMRAGSLK